MATVVANMSMSLDGFIAVPSDDVGPLFDWFRDGPVAVPSADPRWSYHTSEASARHLRDSLTKIGALVCGRRLFDFTKGWGGNHPTGVPVFVVTHTIPDGWPREDAPFTFVIDGIESALAQAKMVAGEKMVAIATPTIAQQCLNAGLLDEVLIDLVPVLLGNGIRFFDNVEGAPIRFDDPAVIEGVGVTHLRYRVRRSCPGPVSFRK